MGYFYSFVKIDSLLIIGFFPEATLILPVHCPEEIYGPSWWPILFTRGGIGESQAERDQR